MFVSFHHSALSPIITITTDIDMVSNLLLTMPPTTTTTTTTTTPHLLTLPPELRNRIYTLALHANPLPFSNGIYHPPTVPVPNLSLLLTNKQVYSEARGIPLELYGVEREFVPATPILGAFF